MAKVPRIVLLSDNKNVALIEHQSWAMLPKEYTAERAMGGDNVEQVTFINTGKRWHDTSINAKIYLQQGSSLDITPFTAQDEPDEVAEITVTPEVLAEFNPEPLTEQQVNRNAMTPPEGPVTKAQFEAQQAAGETFATKALLYYLNWSTKYMRAMRENDTKKLNKLEKEWNPEKDLLGK